MKTRLNFFAVALAVLMSACGGPKPRAPHYTNKWPVVPEGLNALEDYIRQTEAAQPIRKDNHARVIWQDSVPTKTEYSFVYLHGFAGSYRDGYPLNVNVADTFGANIYLSRWAGHGLVPPASLDSFSPETAWESAKEALLIGHRIGKKVVIISTSTGGTLALKLAAAYPDSVYGLINISPNIKDDQMGASLLTTEIGPELAQLISLGEDHKVKQEPEAAEQYWDTLYPAQALVELQLLVESTMKPELYRKVSCPVLTLYYHKNILKEDEHVEVSVYPDVHGQLATPDSMVKLVALDKPGTHFIGSAIKSEDYLTAQDTVIQFCRQKLGMELKNPTGTDVKARMQD